MVGIKVCGLKWYHLLWSVTAPKSTTL